MAVTTPVCLLVTYLTPPVPDETLRDFYNKVQPDHWGWTGIAEKHGITRTLYFASDLSTASACFPTRYRGVCPSTKSSWGTALPIMS